MTIRFSDRIGVTQRPKLPLVTGEINNEIATAIWNLLLDWVAIRIPWDDPAKAVAQHVINFPTDEIPIDCGRDWVKDHVLNPPWYVAYNVLEFLVDWLPAHTMVPRSLEDEANHTLELQGSGYRFIDHKIAPVASREEVGAVEEAIDTSRAALPGASIHLSAAVAALSKKPDPDYLNSIKESILAIESVASAITGEKPDGLAGPLQKLAEQSYIHPAMVKGFIKLYGFTSDEGGIRHALIEDPRIGFDEAKFMLVACSAFVNFLISKASASGLLRSDP